MTKLVKNLNKAINYLTIILMAVMVVLVLLQIFSRTFLGSSFSWTEELSRFLMIWVVFIGSASAFRYGAHISITIIYDRLSERFQRVSIVIINLFCILFLLIFIIKGYELSQSAMVQISPALQIPMGYVYYIFPIAGVLHIINIIDLTINTIRSGKVSVEEEV